MALPWHSANSSPCHFLEAAMALWCVCVPNCNDSHVRKSFWKVKGVSLSNSSFVRLSALGPALWFSLVSGKQDRCWADTTQSPNLLFWLYVILAVSTEAVGLERMNFDKLRAKLGLPVSVWGSAQPLCPHPSALSVLSPVSHLTQCVSAKKPNCPSRPLAWTGVSCSFQEVSPPPLNGSNDSESRELLITKLNLHFLNWHANFDFFSQTHQLYQWVDLLILSTLSKKGFGLGDEPDAHLIGAKKTF